MVMPALLISILLPEEVIKPAIAVVEGVYSVSVYGSTPREWELSYDQQKLAEIGISSSAISASINNYLLEMELGGASETMAGGAEIRTYLTLEGNNKEAFRWDDIPVARTSGRIIHLTDVAKLNLRISVRKGISE